MPKFDDISQEILDYLEAPSDLIPALVNCYKEFAENANRGIIVCQKDLCCHYIKDDFDGYGYRDIYCSLNNKQNRFCPYKQVKPFVLDPPYLVDPKNGLVDINQGINKKFKAVFDEVYGDE